MLVERLLYPITALGPGNRVVVWTAGCSKRCPQCENPELWTGADRHEIDVKVLAKEINRLHELYGANAITFTGGDPLEQIQDLEDLLLEIRPYFSDILVYTGFTVDELKLSLGKQRYADLKKLIDVLVDGRYIENENDGSSPLRGSSNQKVVFFSNGMRKKYEEYMSCGRLVQNVAYNGKVVSVGIHNKELLEEIANE